MYIHAYVYIFFLNFLQFHVLLAGILCHDKMAEIKGREHKCIKPGLLCSMKPHLLFARENVFETTLQN